MDIPTERALRSIARAYRPSSELDAGLAFLNGIRDCSMIKITILSVFIIIMPSILLCTDSLPNACVMSFFLGAFLEGMR